MIFRDGVVMFSQPGALSKETLDDLITQVGALDMDQVHAELAGSASPADS